GRVQQAAAVVALVAARLFVGAVGAGPFDIAVGQEAGVVDRLDHPVHALLDQAALFQHLGEVLGQAGVRGVGAAAENVEGQAEGLAGLLLDLMLLVAIGADVLAGGGGRQLGRGAVLVG